MASNTSKRFPDGFTWGTATASYQIEGAAHEDGRGESIWDRFSKTPGKVTGGDTGDVACDHYHRYKEDVRLIRGLGVQSYRFSVAWPRLFPERGRFNPKGVDFYKRLVDELLQNGISPMATIYHWDLPQWLEDAGGWTSRDTVKYFVEYAHKLFEELGDVVPQWITHNEPWCAAWLGYGFGVHAPGHTSWREALSAAHHLLLSHGEAVEAYKSSGLSGQIGISLNLGVHHPATHSLEDKAAASREDGFANRWFLDPLFKGRYPTDMVNLFERHFGPLDFIQPYDLQVINTPTDFLGINYYTRQILRAKPGYGYFEAEHLPPQGPVTDMGWEVHPESLYRLLKRLAAEYTTLPLYVTENGAAYPDALINGEVNDTARIEYLRAHFNAALQFIDEGGNLKGYYVWSLMDNFEWSFGYSKRFGIVYVDYETQQRTLKASATWFRHVVAENAIV